MQKKQIVRTAAWLLCLMFTLLTCSTTALAYEQIDTNHLVSLTLSVAEKDPANPGDAKTLAGIPFMLYRIATVDNTANYTVTSKFVDAGVDVSVLDDADAMSEAGFALRTYITKNNIEADMTAISGENGRLSFKDMKPGLFLVIGTTTEVGGYSYAFAPVMAALPSLEDGEWVYDQISDLKLVRTQKLVKLTVVKSWADEKGQLSKRPRKILVDLLCDGEVVTTVELNSENGWKYVFLNLNASHEYTVKEHDIGSDYKVSYGELTHDADGNAHITITNTYVKPDKPDIPQTGLLWWPVPVLALAGMVLFAIGWMMNRKEGQQ